MTKAVTGAKKCHACNLILTRYINTRLSWVLSDWAGRKALH